MSSGKKKDLPAYLQYLNTENDRIQQGREKCSHPVERIVCSVCGKSRPFPEGKRGKEVAI